MRSWIDIENAPQVQYLSPFKAALEARGHDVVVTARDQGITLELLRRRGIEPVVVGGHSGRSIPRKAASVGARALRLASLFRERRRPDLLVAASRPSSLAARRLGIPSFQFMDYEHEDTRIYRLTGTHLLYPDVIDPQAFVARGIRPNRLVPFAGLKEAISFAGIDVETVAPHPFPQLDERGLVKVLFRAPGEATHYFVQESLTFALELLGVLARREDVAVVYVPRYAAQAAYVEKFSWANEPVVLRDGVPFVPLLKGVDTVISSGGTMVREAAYLGVPAFSILRSRIGQVDRYLESIGRLRIVETADDLAAAKLAQTTELAPLPSTSPDLVGSLAEAMIERARATS